MTTIMGTGVGQGDGMPPRAEVLVGFQVGPEWTECGASDGATGSWIGAGLLRRSKPEWQAMVHASRYCVKELALRNHTSVRTLQRQILAMTGKRPHQWMRDMRMARAVELLADNSKVEWVSGELGYVSRNHFARDFKKYWGYPPSEHARRIRAGTSRMPPSLR